MKTVFSRNDQVAHVWGQQSQSKGRSPTPGGGGRFGFASGASTSDEPRVSFRDRVFYSYREPVARLVENASGALCLLYTSRTWSPSTSGHVGSAVSAVSHLIDATESSSGRAWRVPDIGGHPYGGPESGWEGTPRDPDHLRNLEHLADAYRAAVALYEGRGRIRPEYRTDLPEWEPGQVLTESERYYSEAETVARALRRAWAAACDYADAFLAHCGKDRLATLGADWPRTFKAVDAKAAAIMTARAERAARALAKLTPRELERREAVKVERAAKRERERALRFADAAEKLAGWRDGLRLDRWNIPQNDGRGGALIRAIGVKRDRAGAITGGTLQTSQGADVPLCHAIRAFRFLKLCHDTGRAWEANGRTIRVGHFTISRVEPSGDFVAGCHRINWPEIEALAQRLGVFDLPPAEDALEPSRHAA